MRTIAKLGTTLFFAAALGYGGSWSAKIIDASCYDNRSTEVQSHESLARACVPTTATTEFAFVTTAAEPYHTPGKVYKVDPETSMKMENDVQNGALQVGKDGEMHAMVIGSLKDGVVNVNSVVVDK